jgi:hypothetical protein
MQLLLMWSPLGMIGCCVAAGLAAAQPLQLRAGRQRRIKPCDYQGVASRPAPAIIFLEAS